MAKQLVVEVWSDIACPWCYVGKRRLESALARFEHRDDVRVVWRAFELDPSAPRERDRTQSYAARLASKYGRSEAQAQEMIQHMVGVAAAEGLPFDFERIRSGNTFDAHRVLHLAALRGQQDALKERFLRAYFCEGQPIGDHETLLTLASAQGLDVDELQSLLSSDLYAEEVRAEQREARDIGVSGVPFFLLGRKYAVAGAQPAEVLLQALNKAWAEQPELTTLGAADGAVCGPDGCA
jgi:predicted DsbA family dithiol-disulfide isomerase